MLSTNGLHELTLRTVAEMTMNWPIFDAFKSLIRVNGSNPSIVS